ncbi:hypothetical protein FACS189451_11650 [Bacteroidia bacterium]|nr:hypothetical protein FACS189451_11650 [Bacteroidia bacterium]
MELEELKISWLSLEKRLSKQEKLNANIIREMLVSKSNKSLNRLINYNFFGIIVCLVLVPVFIWQMSQKNPVTIQLLLMNVLIFLVVTIIYGIVDLRKLYQIDFSKTIGWNIHLTQKYKIFGKRMLIASYIIVILLMLTIIILSVIYVKMMVWYWGVLILSIAIGAAGAWWEYKQLFIKNVDSIIECLEELKELEEE